MSLRRIAQEGVEMGWHVAAAAVSSWLARRARLSRAAVALVDVLGASGCVYHGVSAARSIAHDLRGRTWD